MKDHLYLWGNKFSIFYNQAEFHYLIKQCIGPSIKHLEKDLIEYTVSFSSTHGEHINVIFKTNKSDNLIEKQFLKKVRRFLSSNPSFIKPVNAPYSGFFMDYPNNSLWTNLNNHIPDALKEKHHQIIEQSISNAIVDVFSNDEVNSDNVDAFLIYMHLGIIKSAHPSIDVAAKIASELCFHYDAHLKHAVKKTTMDEYNDVNLSFNNNKDQIADIILDIWRTESFEPELKWMTIWIFDCTKFLKGKDFVHYFIEISRLIYEHVGIKYGSLSYLFTVNLLSLLNKIPANK